MSAGCSLERFDRLLRTGGVAGLRDHVDGLIADAPDERGLRSIGAALRISASTLARDPSQLSAQLLARLGDLDDATVRRLAAEASEWDRRPWLRPLTASLSGPAGPMLLSLPGHTDQLTAVAVSRDGRRAVSGSVPRTVKLWDLEQGVELRTLRGYGQFGAGEGYGQDVDAIALDADGARVASANGDGRIHVWDCTSGALVSAAAGNDDEDWRTALSPHLRWAASAFRSSIVPMIEQSQAGTIEVRNLESGECRTLRSPGGRFDALAISDHGPTLVASAGGLQVWDLGRDDVRTIAGPTGSRRAVAISDDGCSVVTGHADGTVTVWDLQADTTSVLSGHSAAVTTVAITPDGRVAVSGSDDSTVRAWDLEQMTEITTLTGHVGGVNGVAVTADGRHAVSGGSDRVLRVWDLRTPTERIPPRRLPVRSVAIAASGQRVYATSEDGTVEVWDLTDRVNAVEDRHESAEAEPPTDITDRIEALEQEHSNAGIHEVIAIAATPDRRRAVCASHSMSVLSAHHQWAVDQSTVRVWDLGPDPTATTVASRTQNVVGPQRTELFRDVAISSDGRYVAAVGDDQSVGLYDVDSGSVVACFATDSPLQACAVSLDGRTIVAGGETGDVHLLRLIADGDDIEESEPRSSVVDEIGVVEFYPEGLLHKFGFGDGDMLYLLIEDHDLDVDHQDLLIAVVEQLVVPRLDQHVDTYTLVSLHNPIRAATVDGEEAHVSSTITPKVIEVPVADIIRVARTLPPGGGG